MAFRSLLLSVASVCFLNGAVNPALVEVKSVYLLPMTGGLDQYLANHLTKVGRFQVVTDAKRADVIITDRLGATFEDKWKELFPVAAPVEAAGKTAASLNDEKKPAKSTDPFDPAASGARPTWTSRGRGTIFFVNRKDGAVVWSHYKTPENSQSKSMDEVARKIVTQLENDLKPPKD